MTASSRCLLVLPVVAATTLLLLGACSKPATPPPANASAAASPFVAIARGRVDVEGGLVHVTASREGIVSQLHGAIGDAVKAGDPLVLLDPQQASIALDAARADLKASSAQATLLRAKLPGLKTRAARISEAAQAGASSGQSADDAKQSLAELDAEIAVADANVEASRQKIKQAEFEVAARSLRAPVAGRIVARTAHIGDVVAPATGDLVELLPDAPRIVRAELNEGFVAKVGVGMNAEVHSEADPAKTYSARVIRIGDVFGPSKLVESGQDATDTRDVECILELANADLRVGQRVQVRFLPAAN
jgi:multidrug resistance efflux pump